MYEAHASLGGDSKPAFQPPRDKKPPESGTCKFHRPRICTVAHHRNARELWRLLAAADRPPRRRIRVFRPLHRCRLAQEVPSPTQSGTQGAPAPLGRSEAPLSRINHGARLPPRPPSSCPMASQAATLLVTLRRLLPAHCRLPVPADRPARVCRCAGLVRVKRSQRGALQSSSHKMSVFAGWVWAAQTVPPVQHRMAAAPLGERKGHDAAHPFTSGSLGRHC